jgi:hypothetical protein
MPRMRLPPWPAAATVGAIIACCAAVFLAFRLGRVWTRSTQCTTAFGLLVGFLCAGTYFVLALAIETLWPTTLDAWSVGALFAVLCIAAPASGALAAYLGHIL